MRRTLITLTLVAWIAASVYVVLTTSLDWPFIVAPVLVTLGLAGYGIIGLMVYFLIMSITSYGKTAQLTDNTGLLPDTKSRVRKKTKWKRQADLINMRDE